MHADHVCKASLLSFAFLKVMLPPITPPIDPVGLGDFPQQTKQHIYNASVGSLKFPTDILLFANNLSSRKIKLQCFHVGFLIG